jgi:hypothetical protein
MFKKSILEGAQQNPPKVGSIVFNGYAEVRTSPKSLPPFLIQRLRMGKDVISIWFHHAHTELFRQLDKYRDVKIISDKSGPKDFLPKIDEMTPRQIIEFCRSIEVHPAHLVPFNSDMRLSLPTRLLEVLIDIAEGKTPKEGGGFDIYDQDDIYLAKAAIAFECKRIQQYMKDEKRLVLEGKESAITLSGVFKDVLDDPRSMRAIFKASQANLESFNALTSQSYPYFERVKDRAIVRAEEEIESSNYSIGLKKDLYQHRIDAFVKEYKRVIDDNGLSQASALVFLDEVLERLGLHGSSRRGIDIEENKRAIREVMRDFGLNLKPRVIADKVYTDRFGVCKKDLTVEEEKFLDALEEPYIEDLAYAVRLILDIDYSLLRAKQRHVDIEGDYILEVGRISQAFDSVSAQFQRNIMNNRVLLRLFNYSVDSYTAPQTSPK